MRILIIEDDAEAAEYLAKGLRESGHTADVAADGSDGLIQAAAEAYDVLIVDRMLPKLDGLSLVQHLRATGNTTPIAGQVPAQPTNTFAEFVQEIANEVPRGPMPRATATNFLQRIQQMRHDLTLPTPPAVAPALYLILSLLTRM